MVSKRGTSWLACSPDAVAWIDVSHLILFSSEDLHFTLMEIKTGIATSSLDRILHNGSEHGFSVAVGDKKCVTTKTHEHSDRILQ